MGRRRRKQDTVEIVSGQEINDTNRSEITTKEYFSDYLLCLFASFFSLSFCSLFVFCRWFVPAMCEKAKLLSSMNNNWEEAMEIAKTVVEAVGGARARSEVVKVVGRMQSRM